MLVLIKSLDARTDGEVPGRLAGMLSLEHTKREIHDGDEG